MISRKIAITGDVLRPDINGKFSQEYNINWFYDFISEPLLQIGIKPDKIGYDEFQTLEYYKAIEKPFNVFSWADIYNKPNKALINIYLDYDYIIGFELPNCIKKSLSNNGITWIDFVISPIRFLESDVYLTCSSNNLDMLKRLDFLFKKYVQPDFVKQIKSNVDRIKQSAPKLFEENTGVFIGQTSYDRTLIFNKEFLDLRRKFKSHALKAPETNVRYKPHPYQKEEIEGIETTDANIYDILSQDNVTIYGWNSSALYEAMQFKIPYFKMDNNEFYKDYYTFLHHYLIPEFWQYVFSTKSIYIPFECFEQNKLRKIVGSWGHK